MIGWRGRAQRAGGEGGRVGGRAAERAGADRHAVVVEGDRAGGVGHGIVPGLAMLTVAVKVTLWPDTLGLARRSPSSWCWPC